MAGQRDREAGENDIFAALVSVDGGPLTASAVHVTELVVEGEKGWPDWPFLCSVSGGRALLYFDEQNNMWYCDIVASSLVMRKLETRMPSGGGFRTVPLRLPNDRLLVAGSSSSSTSRDITVILPHEEPRFEKAGEIAGPLRCETSTVLIGGRFVVGFGGCNYMYLDDLWVFDVQTRESSPVTKKGEWHPATSWSFLAVQEDVFYIISGIGATSVHSIPLSTLASLIQDPTIRSSFLTTCQKTSRPARQVVESQCASDTSSIEAKDQEIAQLNLSLTETKQKLAISEQSLQDANSQIDLLTRERDQAREQINDLERRVSALREENERLRQNQVPPGAVVIHLPSKTLPPISFPQKWMIDAPGLQKFNTSIEAHQESLPHKQSFLQEYRKVFRPLLEETLGRRLFGASSSVLPTIARAHSVFQVASSLEPGCICPSNAPLPSLARLYPLRPEGKFLDGSVARTVLSIFHKRNKPNDAVLAHAPPSYGASLSSVNSHDPLWVDTIHASSTRLRRVIHASKILRASQTATELGETIQFLQKAQRLANQGYDGPDAASYLLPE